MPPFIDLTGQRFGRLLVLRRVGRRKWLCVCDCGGQSVSLGYNLKSGSAGSCGCYQRERAAEVGRRCARHGESRHSGPGRQRSREWIAWMSMRQRCLNSKHKSYKDYGGRGISICERWGRYENFLCDMGRRPSVRHTLERKDVDGDYCPENCCWATGKQQCRNRRNNKLVEFGGQTKCLSEWAEIYGVTFHLLYDRLKRGWSFERAIATPAACQRKVAP